jgi:polyisoprenoid-binding protein YceI
MRRTNRKSAALAVGLLGVCIVVISAPCARSQSAPVAAPGINLLLDPAQSQVHYTVDTTLHTVHGTFKLKSGNVHIDPASGKASGEIIVLATSGDSGNSSRDEKMHKEVLESSKYPDVVFHPTQLEGKLAPTGDSDLKLHGIINLHGQEHEIAVALHAHLTSGQWTATANFDIPFIQWGLKDPSNWLLKVKPTVQMELTLAGTSRPAS